LSRHFILQVLFYHSLKLKTAPHVTNHSYLLTYLQKESKAKQSKAKQSKVKKRKEKKRKEKKQRE